MPLVASHIDVQFKLIISSHISSSPLARRVTFADDNVLCQIDPLSCRIDFAHDEQDCAWQQLNSILEPGSPVAGLEFVGACLFVSGVKVHEGDCLLLSRDKNAASVLLDVVQVQKIEETTPGIANLILRPFLRPAIAPPAASPGHKFRDPAHLVLAARDQSFAFDDAKHVIVRKCVVTKGPVAHRLEGDELFWTSSSGFQACSRCESQRVLAAKITGEVISHSLRTLDLFAGAGGLTLGLGLAGNIKTKWAVEMDAARARTLQASHPRTAVFTADASELLAVVCEKAESNPLSSALPSASTLPKRGEVDILVAGPPCQSFSKLNAHRAATDGRNLLIAVTLSWVEVLRPDYVVVENVGGIMDNETLKLGAINQGFPKLIVLTLLQLGYSVRIANVEAVSCGSPQERRRMIFLAAKEGLPCLPPASHITPSDRLSRSSSIRLWPGDGAPSRHFTMPNGFLRGCAPLPTVTVMDAIDDLPAFDWSDPHQVYPLRASPLDREKAARAARGIPALDAVRLSGVSGEHLVGAKLQRYGTEPRTPYQALMRRGCADARVVSQHQTARHTFENVERVTNVLLRPGANHRSWSSPLVNKPLLTPEWLLSANSLRREDSGKARHSWERSEHSYQRLDPNKPFPTSLTSASPANRQGAVIHPTQTRTLTLRESARVQGFPDWMTWDCSIEEAQKQVGNAVPVPLARMLGRAIIANVVAVEVKKKELREKFRAKSAAKGKGKMKAEDKDDEDADVVMEEA
ncbi:S-adenosyl-L-methionine-dependent methyltransferase [Microstroma glucosiphilum]|uniref:Cytosine-specific methyltransferase n=1 Tax=Pseudomicrostroma glucosiphilum TaxID=1684307 RepID=A0A316UCC3_9BASI|nr:S-adenosyl-L-methionine-dependent methyltransferase [Pseudomicrostroma glucosiphilum]PWN22829.1 S-adenosyl-L-methionine-dependent methyltransferase [Pseudomicrostroma glucosiphilum]